MDCKTCKERFRADKLIEDYMAEKGVEPETPDRRLEPGADEEVHR